jgi:hypothetical protein
MHFDGLFQTPASFCDPRRRIEIPGASGLWNIPITLDGKDGPA